MERPLAAAPGPSFMHGTPRFLTVKNAVTVNRFHLNSGAGNPPVPAGDLFPFEAEGADHAPLVILVQGHGGFTVTAVAAPGTDKNIFYTWFAHLLRTFPSSGQAGDEA